MFASPYVLVGLVFVIADGGVEFDQDVVPLHHLAEDAVLAVQILQLLGQREEKLGAQPAGQHGIYVTQARTRREEDPARLSGRAIRVRTRREEADGAVGHARLTRRTSQISRQ